jgi:uncharacterized protein YraI
MRTYVVRHRFMRRLAIVALGLALILVIAPARPVQAGSIIVSPVSDLNLRSGPDLNAPVIVQVPAKTMLTALARDVLITWIQVNYQGQVGWLYADYLARSGDLSVLPVVGDNPYLPQLLPVNGSTLAGVALRDINVRSGPDLEYPVIGGLTAGTTITLDGKSGEDWYRFRLNAAVEGWVFAPFVGTDGGQANLPDVH